MASQRLLENLPRERDQHPANKLSGYPSNPSGSLSHAENVHHADFRFSARGRHFGAESHEFAELHPDLGPPFPRFHDDVFPGRMPLEMLTFRLLCMTEHIGSIIGKGGSIIRSLQFETGADIRIVEGLAETDVQVVIISAPVVMPFSLPNVFLFGIYLIYFKQSNISFEFLDVTGKISVMYF